MDPLEALLSEIDARDDERFMLVMGSIPQDRREELLNLSEARMERYIRLLGERGERAAEKRRRWGISAPSE